jgi:Fe-S oxidoreductase
MAGSFGFEREHYQLSLHIGRLRLFPAIRAAADTQIAASGVSCRQQIAQGTGRIARHPVALLHDACSRAQDRLQPNIRHRSSPAGEH